MRDPLSVSVVLIGHGSKVKGFETPMKKVARDLKASGRYRDVQTAYLEIASPSIGEAVERCVKRGAASIKLLPYFLLLGAHVTEDLPAIAARERKRFRQKAAIELCPYLGYDPKISAVAKKRLEAR